MTNAQLSAEPGAVPNRSRLGSDATHAAEGDAGRCPSRHVLGMRVDATSYAETAETIAALAAEGAGGAVCVATVHMVMESFDDPEFRTMVNASDRVTPDGVPLVWALRWLGVPTAERVYGPSLLPWVCGLAQDRGIPVGFYGGTAAVCDAVVARISTRFPRLSIPFSLAPPFRPVAAIGDLDDADDARVVEEIRASGVRVLFVGLGCPKQERWIAAHRARLPCVLVGVGAAFDFIAGSKRQAPPLLQRAGLEWLFRLVSEPRRLWRRYLVQNPRFVYHFGRQLFGASEPRADGGLEALDGPESRR